MLSDTQRCEFEQRGFIKIPGMLDRTVIEPLCETVFDTLAETGHWLHGDWHQPENWTFLKEGGRLRRALKQCFKSNRFYGLTPGEVSDMAASLADESVSPWNDRPQLLFTPPQSGQWRVPHNVWHLDVPRLGDLDPPGVQMFTFLNQVDPQGGGTLIVAGSHRLLNDEGKLRSKHVKRRLRRMTFFRELMDRHLPDRDKLMDRVGEADGVQLEIVELTGHPGDVYFTDLRLLHTLSTNTRSVPRVMATQRYQRQSVVDRLLEP